ncbi:glycerophosphodiester phosphodiesterase [Jeotgalibacillus alimentarius]|uniref:Glycerophosphodiester phosphodiesterase n=1 Tax=Jeotgalibacillus alimentarius TaxID=135826 RepID=A0A0C2V130_9BACL|nr:glycerophosphodiester phosphodiesterase [Jeotgalibacillus alimentarius]KIL42772.1 glycerophosphodiester phosphodiesterase [Jeotgalibacillus alimentarius]
MTTFYAHRGASTMCPENTMAAFRQALREKADGIEVDVQLSKDGEAVVIHDETVDRTTNGTGAVKDMTVLELKQLDAGSWYNQACAGETLPLLEEVLKWIGRTELKLNIELKTDREPYPGIEQVVIDAVRRHELADRVVLSSFNLETLRRVRDISSSVSIAVLVWDNIDGIVKCARHLGADAIHARPGFMHTAESLRAEAAGLPIRLYTVNEPEDLKGISLQFVDGVFTDSPARLRGKLGVGEARVHVGTEVEVI